MIPFFYTAKKIAASTVAYASLICCIALNINTQAANIFHETETTATCMTSLKASPETIDAGAAFFNLNTSTSAMMATITVCASGCNFTSIQAAVNAASNNDIISIGAGTYTESEIVVSKTLTFQGAGLTSTIVQANADVNNATERVFVLTGDPANVMTFEDMTIQHGNPQDGLGGGGILNYAGASLVLNRVSVSDNWATKGGGIFVEQANSLLSVNDCLLSNNNIFGGDDGGGIYYNSVGGTAYIRRSSFYINRAGGGTGDHGGGIYFIEGTMNLTNCFFSGNSFANVGGGLYDGSTTNNLSIVNCTFSDNNSTSVGGGIYMVGGTGTDELINTIVYYNVNTSNAPNNFHMATGSLDTNEKNIVENCTGGCPTFYSSADPLLLGLNDCNGLLYENVLKNSPAIDAGTTSGAPSDDLCGVTRTGNPDIGATEYNPTTFTVCQSGCDYQTIQAAHNAAGTVGSGDIVEVMDAIHTEQGISITKPITIKGQGQNTTTVQAHATRGSATDRVFDVTAVSPVYFEDMTIQHGNASDGEQGGAVDINHSVADVTFTNVTLKNNDGTSGGGAIGAGFSGSMRLTLTNCLIEGNTAGGSGGGIVYSSSGFFTMTNCTVNNNSAADDGGGILRGSGGVAILTDCNITNNQAGGDSGDTGGGIRVADGALTLINCMITGNSNAHVGGGIYDDCDDAIIMTNCTISNNTAAATGAAGGYYMSTGGTNTLTNCTINNNTAGWGGGIYNTNSTTLTLTGCDISNNNIVEDGGGLYLSSAGSVTMDNCTITNNQSNGDDGDSGGGIYINEGTLTLTGCTISSNSNVGWGGGIIDLTAGAVNISNCIIDGNSANLSAGGIYLQGGTKTISKTTIANNTATNWYGGGVYISGATPSFTNCTIHSNTANVWGGGIYDGDAASNSISLINNTIVNNSTNFDVGGVRLLGEDYTMTNNIIANNIVTSGANGVAHDLFLTDIGTGTISNNLVESCVSNTGACPTFASSNDPQLGAVSVCGIQHYFPIMAGSDAENGGTSTGAPTDDICGTARDASPNMGSSEEVGAGGFAEIDLSGMGVNILNGDTSPQVNDDTDFGPVNAYGSDTDTHVFTITNNGNIVLNISSVTLSNTTDFSIVSSPSSVEVGGSESLSIQFDPAIAGVKTSTVTIDNNDDNENPFTFTIQGTGACPAGTVTVCASGCHYTTIQAAIDSDCGTVIEVQDAVHTEQGITVDRGVTIQGQGQGTTTVQANAARNTATDRVFLVTTTETVLFQNMTIQHGYIAGDNDGGGILVRTGTNADVVDVTVNQVTLTKNDAGDDGGAMGNYNAGTIEVTDCIIEDNAAVGSGGGYYDTGSTASNVDFLRTIFNNNDAGVDGGAAVIFNASLIRFIDCVISNNTCVDDGGGVTFASNGANGSFIRCSIFNNQTGGTTSNDGGGMIFLSPGTLSVTNCTIYGNSTGGDGAGIYDGNNSNTVTITNSTIVNNTASATGGGIRSNDSTGQLNMRNCIVANNSSSNGNDIRFEFGGITTNLNNLVEDCTSSSTCPSFDFSVDPDLGALATCGDLSYYPLNCTSPAILAGTTVGAQATDICNNAWGTSPNLGASAEILNEPTAPTAVCQNFTVELDANGNGTVEPTDIDNGSSDNCDPSPTLSIDGGNPTYSCSDVGSVYTLTLNVEDSAGNTASCTADITVAAGSSPSNPVTVCASGCHYTTIQAAIDSGCGTVIEVQDAVHTEQGITVNRGVTIQGQGQGTTTVQANAARNTATDRVFFVNTNETVVFQNMTIRHGNSPSGSDGGAIFVNNGGTGEITCSNMTFTMNDASDDGGAITIFWATNLTVTNCIFTDNTAATSNGGNGGAIYHLGGSLNVSNSSFSNNSAQWGGAVSIINPDYTHTFSSNTFSSNSAVTSGGGLYIDIDNETLNMDGCVISGNTCGDDGGGIYVFGDNGVFNFTDCSILNNMAGGGSGNHGGGVIIWQGTSYTFTNCTIAGNGNAYIGGGIADDNTANSLSIINCTVVNNSATSNGGGLSLGTGSGSTHLTNNIIANNGSSDINFWNGTITTNNNNLVETCTVTNSAVCPTFSSTADPDLGTLTTCGSQSYFPLNCGSPAIDAGTTTGAPATDICGTNLDATPNMGSSAEISPENTDPTAICQNYTAQLDGSGNASVTPADIDGGSTDDCGTPTLSITAGTTSYTCSDAGSDFTVTLTVTDGSMNTATCDATVTVLDEGGNCCDIAVTNVAVTDEGCPGADDGTITVTATCSTCTAIEYSINGTDFQNNGNFTGLTDGSYAITVRDTGDNDCSATDSGTVAAGTDSTAPTAVCQDVTVTLDASGNGTLTASQVNNNSSDDCDGSPSLSIDQTSFDCNDLDTGSDFALNLNGIDEYVDLNNAVLPIGAASDPWTVEVWINTTSTDHDVLFSQYYTTSSLRSTIDVNNTITGKFGYWKSAAGGLVVSSTTDVNDGNWHHVAIVKEGSGSNQVHLYVDGVLENSGTDAHPMSNTPSRIGRINLSSNNRFFPGQIDELRIWNVAKSAAEILAYMNSALTGNEADLLAYYSMEDGSGTTVTDNSSNSNNGTLTGDPGTAWVAGTSEIIGGIQQVTLTVTDASNNTSTCSSTATIQDTTNPTITCPAVVTVNTTADLCTASGVALGTPTIADNCSGATASNNAPASYALGANTVTWTVTDGSGNTATCDQTVTVEDNQNPTITCPTAVTVNTDTDLCTASGVALGTPTIADNCTGATASNNAPATYTLGANTVTWTVTDGSGNTATCDQTVTVEDNQNPTITCPTAVTVNTDADLCTASGVALGTPTIADNCSGATASNNAPATYALGANTVTWTVTDGSGNTATCDQTVTVEDNQNPTITCPAAVTANTDADLCTASGVALGTPTIDDNCTGETASNNAPASYALGANTVTWTVTDGSGNTATCDQTVTVIDNQNPDAACQAYTAQIDGTGNASLTAEDINNGSTDDCGTINLSISAGTTAYTCADVGSDFTVTLTVNDGNGNSSTCDATVTVADGSGNCGAGQALNFDGSDDKVFLGDNLYDDLEEGTIEAWVYYTGDDGTMFSTGSQSNANRNILFDILNGKLRFWTRINLCGVAGSTNLVANTWYHVAVTSDGSEWKMYLNGALESLTSINCVTNTGGWFGDEFLSNETNTSALGFLARASGHTTFLQGSLDEVRIWDRALCLDEIQGQMSCELAGNESGLLAYYQFNQGFAGIDNTGETTLIDATSNDYDGTLENFALNGTTSNWIAPGGTVSGSCGSVTCCDIAITNVAVTNEVCPGADDGTITVTATCSTCTAIEYSINGTDFQNSGNFTGLADGTYTITVRDTGDNACSATDSGTVAAGTDTTNPTITCPGAVTVNTDTDLCTASGVVLGTPTIDDNCSGATSSNNAPATYALGANTVTWTVTDGSGNTATCDQTVTVEDNQNPTITCPTAVTVNTDADLCTASGVTLGTPTIDDNCSGATSSNNAPATYALGANTVTWTVTDGSGNTSTCDQTVTVEDNQNPSITCPNSVTVNTDADLCTASGVALGTPTIDDNCTGATSSNNAPATYALGGNTVTWTVTDGSGNTATCDQTVTVEDNQNPTITCPIAVTVNTDADLCTASGVALGTPTIDDNCTGATAGNNAPATYALGGNTVTWTVTDGSGNTATCDQTVTVEDNQNPSITCPTAVTVNTDADLCTASGVTLGTPTIDDNCSGATSSNNAPATYALGGNTVTWTVTDGSGNTATCDQTVTVEDNQNPSITCQDYTAQIDVAGNASVSVTDINNGSSDNCGTPTVSITAGTTAYTCGDVGSTFTVTLTADDGNGQTVTCDATVTVADANSNCCNIAVTDVVVTNEVCPDANDGTITITATCTTCADIEYSINGTDFQNNGNFTGLADGNYTITIRDTGDNECSATDSGTVAAGEDTEAPMAVCQDVTVSLGADGMGSITIADVNNNSSDNCDASPSLSLSQTDFSCEDIAGQTSNNFSLEFDGTDDYLVDTNVDALDLSSAFTFEAWIHKSGNGNSLFPGIFSMNNDNGIVIWIQGNTQLWARIGASQSNFNGGNIPLNQWTHIALVYDGSSATMYIDGVQGVVNNNVFTPNIGSELYIGNWDSINRNWQGNIDEVRLWDVARTSAEIQASMNSTLSGTETGLVAYYPMEDGTNSITATDEVGTNDLTLTNMDAGTDWVAGASGLTGSAGVTLTVTDVTGNESTCTASVTIEDSINPTITCPDAVSVNTDTDACTASGVALGTPTTDDNCSGEIVSNNAPVSFALGINTVTWTVTDLGGNTATCDQTVTVTDNQNPTIICPADQNVDLSATCDYDLLDYTGMATATDNCVTANVTQSPEINTTITTTQTVTLTVTDGSNNTATCTFDVVPADNTNPTITCPSDQNVDLSAACDYDLLDYTGMGSAADNCGTANVTQNPALNTTITTTQTVTLTVTDGSSNTATCTFDVIPSDNTNPTITCPSDQNVDLSAACDYDLLDYTGMASGVTDNCGNPTVSQSPAINTTITTTQTVTLTATDGNSNTATCTFDVIPTDNTNPTITCPADQNVDLSADCDYDLIDYSGMGSAADNCGTANVTQSPAIGTTITATQTVTLTVTDGSSNTATCTFDVIPADNTGPVAACQDVTVTLDGSGNGSITTAQINNGSTDNCTEAANLNLSLSQTDFSCDDLSNYALAFDGNFQNVTLPFGNGFDVGTGDFTVETWVNTTVTGRRVYLHLFGSFWLATENNTIITMLTCQTTNHSVTDGEWHHVAVVRESGTIDIYIDGTSVQTCSNNTFDVNATNGGFIGGFSGFYFDGGIDDVRFWNDARSAAEISANMNQELTGSEAGLVAYYPIEEGTGSNTIADLVNGNDATLTNLDPATDWISGPLQGGATGVQVTLTVTDEAGNSNSCNATVTVEDTSLPTITCPTDQAVNFTADCNYDLLDYTGMATGVADNCGTPSLGQSPAAGTTVSTNATVTLSATDASGNAATCTFDVVITDNTNPTITCPADQNVDLSADCDYDLLDYTGMATAADNCGTANVTQSPAIGTTITTTQTVTLTVTDGSSNTATCTFDVIPADNTNPTITCPGDQNVDLSANCDYDLLDYTGMATAADNCGTANVTQSPVVNTTITTTQTVTLTVTDGSSNTATCTFNVIPADNTNPTITCPGDQNVDLSADCNYDLLDYTGMATAADNCGTANVTQSPATNTAITTTQTVTLTVTDGNSNTASCTFDVIPTDNTNPTITCQDITANLGVDGSVAVTAAQLVATSDDNCSHTNTITAGTSDYICTDLGQQFVVTVTATDGAGNTANCTSTVTVADPDMNCCDASIDDSAVVVPSCEGNTDGSITVSASCDLCASIEYSINGTDWSSSNSFSDLAAGDYTVQIRDSGNHGCNTSQVITVGTGVDSTDPVITCPDAQTVSVDASCEGSAPDLTGLPTATDNCSDAANISFSQDVVVGTALTLNNTIVVTLTATDETGNSHDCTVDLTLIDDTAPDVTCPIDMSVDAQSTFCSASLFLTQATATDNCSTDFTIAVTSPTATIQTIPFMGSSLYFGQFPVGDNEVTWAFTDENGQTGTCTQTVTVVDVTAPTFSNCPTVPITAISDSEACGTNVTWGAVFTQDNCGNQTVTTLTHDSGDFFPVGTTTVTYTATDPGNNSTQCIFDVIVTDDTPPVVNCQDTEVFLDGSGAASIEIEDVVTSVSDNCSVNIADVSFDTSNFDCSQAGTVITVTASVDDVNGVSGSCTAEVTVTDNTNPSAICQDLTISLSAEGTGSVVAAEIDNGSDDNCPNHTLAITDGQTNYDCTDAGQTYTLTLTVTDASNNTATCTSNISVVDDTNPTITCPSDVSVGTDEGMCTAVVNFADPAGADNCSGHSVAQTLGDLSGTAFSTGVSTITYEVTDASGNTASCSFTITVSDDENPSITACPGDITQVNDEDACSAVINWTAPTADDNCGVDSFNSTHSSGAAFEVGTTTVTYTATDEAGNSSTCVFNVTVNDTQNPVITCPTDISIGTDDNVCTAIVTYSTPEGTDNCAGSLTTLTAGGASNTAFSIGTTTVTYLVTDASNNTVNCSFNVTVSDDEAPSIAACPSNITQNNDAGNCSAVVNWSAPTADDNCGVDSFTSTSQIGDTFDVGDTDVTYTAVDEAGNETTCTFTITVVDAENPQITCPDNITQTNDAGVCGANITYSVPVGTDNCAGAVTSLDAGQDSGTVFTVGTTTVSYNVVDAAGNSASCSFTVTITDDENPTIANCPENITQNNDAGICGAIVNWNTPTAADNCNVASFPSNHNIGDTFPVGDTEVTYTATDDAANTATCSFTITVVDAEAPQISCPSNITQNNDTGVCTAVVNWTAPVGTDNCSGSVTELQTTNYPIGATFPLGSTDVTYKVTDAAGNETSCTFSVTIVDAEDPVAICQDITVQLDAAGAASIEAADVNNNSTDNCNIASMDVDPRMFDCSNVGANTVTLTITDDAGNEHTCTANVTIEDMVAPVANCQDLTIDLDENGSVSILAADVDNTSTDACGIAGLAIDMASFDCSNLGANTVTLTVTDNNSNESTCTATVTVEDNVAPVISDCPSDISVDALTIACAGSASWTEPTYTDNCGTATSTLDTEGVAITDLGEIVFGTFPGGETTISYTVSDPQGNESICSFVITVVDNDGPVITGCPDNIVVDNTPGDCSGVALWVPPLATDNCSGLTLTGSHLSGETFGIGETTVTYTATDANNNESTCDFTVTVNDTEAPSVTCPAEAVAADDGNCSYTVPDLTGLVSSTDNCEGDLTTTQDVAVGTSISGGTTVTMTVSDGSNSANCSITVVAPTTMSLTTSSTDASCSNANDGTATVSISGGSAPYTIMWSSGGSTETETGLAPGDYNVSVTDNNGCVTEVTVTVGSNDTTPPTLFCDDHNVSLDANGQASININDVAIVMEDNCGIATMSISQDNFTCANIGGNTVTVIVTDIGGLTSTCDATVTVEDNIVTTPSFCGTTIDLQLGSDGLASIGAGDFDPVMDNCGTVLDILILGQSTFSCAFGGLSLVVPVAVLDESENFNICTINVNISDASAPTALCQDANVSLGSDGTVNLATSAIDGGSDDNCGIATSTVSPSNFNCGDLGANTVTLVVTDDTGLTASCTATVTVVDDSAPTPLFCDQNVNLTLDFSGAITLTTGNFNTAIDNCSSNPSISILGQSAFDCNDAGNTIAVAVSATDAQSNVAQCNVNVNITDINPPIALCQNASVAADENGIATVSTAAINNGSFDNCSIASMTATPNTFSCSGDSDNEVTLTVTDPSGNTATCTATVTVTGGGGAGLQANCKDVTVNLDASGNASITAADIDNGSFGCDLSLSVSPSSFTCSNIGNNQVTLTATESGGASATCTAMVTVADNIAPVAVCQDLIVNLDAGTGMAVIIASDINDGSTDNCGINVMNVSPSVFGCEDGGDNTVTLTVTDNGGNASTCTATVSVGYAAPTAMCQTSTVTVGLGDDGTVTVDPAVIDNGSSGMCDNLTLSVQPATFDCADAGSNSITLLVTDGLGQSASCTATVEVVDNSVPLPDFCGGSVNIELDADGSVNIEQSGFGSHLDNCGSTPLLIISLGQINFTCDHIGTTPDLLVALIDGAGNLVTCFTDVVVTDPNGHCGSGLMVNENLLNEVPTAKTEKPQIEVWQPQLDENDNSLQLRGLTNTPNPFSYQTKISYRITAPAEVQMWVMDQSGRLVTSLTKGAKAAGEHNVFWKPEGNVTPGVYILIVQLDNGNVHHLKMHYTK